MKFRTIPSMATAVLGLWLAPAPRAEAAYIATMLEVGPNVVVTGAGSFNLSALSYLTVSNTTAGVLASSATITVGPAGQVPADFYRGTLSGPSNFGSSVSVLGDDGTGDRTGMTRRLLLFVPEGYANGSPLSGMTLFLNQSFATLGVTPGTYVWTWGEGETLDSFTLNIGVVPEPASLALLGAGLAGLGVMRRRRA